MTSLPLPTPSVLLAPPPPFLFPLPLPPPYPPRHPEPCTPYPRARVLPSGTPGGGPPTRFLGCHPLTTSSSQQVTRKTVQLSGIRRARVLRKRQLKLPAARCPLGLGTTCCGRLFRGCSENEHCQLLYSGCHDLRGSGHNCRYLCRCACHFCS